MTTKKSIIAQSIDVIRELDVDEPSEPATFAVLHLGHPSSPKYGTVEYMTFEQYERFKWLNTWPRPKKV